MDIGKIVAAGLVTALLSSFLRQYNKEYSIIIALAFTLLVFYVIAPLLKDIISFMEEFFTKASMDTTVLAPLMKIIGIALVTQFGRDLCIDAGETAIANRIELAGKLLIVAVSLPILFSLFELVISVLE